jgi:hypothetical protein
VAGIGLAAAVFAVGQRSFRAEVRIMAALGAGVTLVTAVTSPAALPPTQPQAWASGRYLDGMIVVFFLVGLAVLLRCPPRRLVVYTAGVVTATLLTAIVVFAYAGGSVPTSGFGAAFVLAEPAVLTQDWTAADVLLATVAGLGLLVVSVGVVLVAARGASLFAGPGAPSRAGRRAARLAGRAGVFAGLGAVSLVASLQMTSHISQASTPGQERNVTALVTGTGLKPGQHLAIGTGLSWQTWIPQAYVVWWTPLESFNPAAGQPPPADATVVEVAWPTGQPAAASWPRAPAGWRIAVTDPVDGWVAWRR